MFFEGWRSVARRDATIRRPPVNSTWRHSPFPNLSSAKVIGFDVEGYDPELTTKGPGWARNRSHLVGVSLSAIAADGTTGAWYWPFRHEVETHLNLDANNVLGFVNSILSDPSRPKVGANIMYDIGCLQAEGVQVNGELHDCQFAEALLDERGLVKLDYLGHKYLGIGKEKDELSDWSRAAYGGGVEQRQNIYRAPPQLVGPYAETDALLPLQIMPHQFPWLSAEGLRGIYNMECDSIHMLLKMRWQGVRVNLDYAEQVYNELEVELETAYEKSRDLVGFRMEGAHTGAAVKSFKACGVAVPEIAGKPMLEAEWLKACKHPIAACLLEIREIEKLRSTFLKSYILDGHVKGKIHCEFHPLKGEDGGTKTGRAASSHPNLQNIPVRSARGKKMRRIFIPHEGHVAWEKDDHSQLEYRMLANYAEGAGAEELRRDYWDNPKTDYHDRVFIRWCRDMGLNYENMSKEEKKARRRPIKNINFGLIYGQTEPSLAYKAGMGPAEARSFFGAYHSAAPYVKATMQAISEEVQAMGFITTILGRRTRFDMWEPLFRQKGQPRQPAMPYEAALGHYGPAITRAFAYRATNYRFQGSAAEVLKRGMLQCYQEGVFDVIGYPLLQVHDELDFSVIDDSPRQNEGYAYMRHVLQTCLTNVLRVPLSVEPARGPNWGELED